MSAYLFIGVIFWMAGFTQGVSGFGAALVAMPLLTLFLDVKAAVPLCMLNGLLITLFLSVRLKSHFDWGRIRPLFIGCIPGILFGVLLLKGMDSNILKVALGVLIVSYSAYRLSFKGEFGGIRSAWGYVAGFATGVIGAAFSAGGPPTIIYVSLTGWKKDEIKAALSGFFFTTGVVTSAAHAVSGLITGPVLAYFAASCLFTCAGVFMGSRFSDRIKQETYIKIMLSLLVFLGLMMIVTAFL